MGRVDRLVDDLDARVKSMTVRRVKKQLVRDDGSRAEQTELKLDELLRRVRHLVAVDTRVAMVDGWSSTTPGNGSPGGGKGGGRVMVIPDEAGEPDRVPTTSTEAAAFANVEARPPADPVHQMKVAALASLRRIAHEFEQLDSTLQRFDNIRSAGQVEDPPQCWFVSVRLGLPWDQAWEPWRSTDFAGVLQPPLDEPRKVCKFVYWFVRDNRRLPSRAEALKYLERGTVKVKAS